MTWIGDLINLVLFATNLMGLITTAVASAPVGAVVADERPCLGAWEGPYSHGPFTGRVHLVMRSEGQKALGTGWVDTQGGRSQVTVTGTISESRLTGLVHASTFSWSAGLDLACEPTSMTGRLGSGSATLTRP